MFAREREPTLVGDGVVRLGTDLCNWFLVEEGGRVTVVDAGLPSYRPQLERGLALLGRTTEDVAAIALTHGHADHIGVAERVRRQLGVPAFAHRDDHNLTVTGKAFGKRESSMWPYLLRYRHAWRLVGHFATSGPTKPVESITVFDDGDRLDVPGSPVAIHTGGHTTGHTVFLFESKRALFAGDLICDLNPLTGGRGPQLLPRALNLSSATMIDALAKIEGLDVDAIHFGHGDEWTGGTAEAVRLARMKGPT